MYDCRSHTHTQTHAMCWANERVTNKTTGHDYMLAKCNLIFRNVSRYFCLSRKTHTRKQGKLLSNTHRHMYVYEHIQFPYVSILIRSFVRPFECCCHRYWSWCICCQLWLPLLLRLFLPFFFSIRPLRNSCICFSLELLKSPHYCKHCNYT